MATIKNTELVPKGDLDALDLVYAKIGKASEKTLEWGNVLQGLSAEFSKVNVNYKQLTDLINKYEKVVEEANAVDAERVKLTKEAEKIQAKIAAANSEEAKRVRELKAEYAAINKEIDTSIKGKKAQAEAASKMADTFTYEAKAAAALAQSVKDLEKANRLEAKGRVDEADKLRAITADRERLIELLREAAAIEAKGGHVDDGLQEKIEHTRLYLGIKEEEAETFQSTLNMTDAEREAYERNAQAVAEKGRVLDELAVSEQESREAIRESTSALKSDTTAQSAAQSAFDSLSESIQMQTQGLIEMKLERDEVKEQMKGLTKEYQAGNVTHDAYILRTAELTSLERDLSTAIDTTSKKIEHETTIMTTAAGSYENVAAQYYRMKIEINALGEAEGENLIRKRELEAQAKHLYETMDQLQRATGKNQLNVGNYDSAVTDLTKSVSLLDPKLGMLVRRVQSMTGVKKAWISMNNRLVTSLGVTAKAATMVQIAMVGMVIGGIYLAITAIKSLIDEKKRLREQQEEMIGSAIKERAELITYFSVLSKAEKGTKEYANAKKAIQDKYGEYLKNQREDIRNLKDEKAALDVLLPAITKMAVAKGIQDQLSKSAETYAKKTQGAYREVAEFFGDNEKDMETYMRLIGESNGEMTDELMDFQKQFDKMTYGFQGAAQIVNDLAGSTGTLLKAQRNLNKETGGALAINKAFAALMGDEGEAAKSLIDTQEELLKQAKLLPETTEAEIKVKNQRIKAIETEIARLKGLGIETDKQAKDRQKREKDELKAISEYTLFQVQVEATKQKEVADNDKKFYQTRIQALDSFLDVQKNLLEKSAEADIAMERQRFENGEITAETFAARRSLIEAKFQEELRKITNDGEEIRFGIAKDYADKRIQAVERATSLRAAMTTAAESIALKDLMKSYTSGAISQEEYENKRLDITRKYTKERAQIEMDALKKQLEMLPLDSEQREQLNLKIAEAEIELNKWKNEQIAEDDEKAFEKRKEKTKQYIDFVGEMMSGLLDFASTLISAQTDRELAALEKRGEAAQASHEEETGRIERLEEEGAISTEQANARKAAADQKLREEEKKIEQEKAAAQKKQAEYEKGINVIKIITSTAAGIMRAFSDAGPIAGIPLAAMVAALGAVQLATVLAQPIPEYATGTDSHPGGMAVVGDGHRPEMVLYGGQYFKTPAVPTLIDLPKGAQVFPDWNKAMLSMAFNPIADHEGRREKQPVVNIDLKQLEALQKQNIAELKAMRQSQNADRRNNQFHGFRKNNKNYRVS